MAPKQYGAFLHKSSNTASSSIGREPPQSGRPPAFVCSKARDCFLVCLGQGDTTREAAAKSLGWSEVDQGPVTELLAAVETYERELSERAGSENEDQFGPQEYWFIAWRHDRYLAAVARSIGWTESRIKAMEAGVYPPTELWKHLGIG